MQALEFCSGQDALPVHDQGLKTQRSTPRCTNLTWYEYICAVYGSYCCHTYGAPPLLTSLRPSIVDPPGTVGTMYILVHGNLARRIGCQEESLSTLLKAQKLSANPSVSSYTTSVPTYRARYRAHLAAEADSNLGSSPLS
ncbi:hypothetical protein IAQ61_011769 [Plenodomus lingam]|uniref:uncharacterized protein n=1 Tax=Leptosphaeria maculans TaxID=5022 RepID=UPI00332FCE4B|nr:hypothetical protein IAQ61_011769 [Plenodomus lingam]